MTDTALITLIAVVLMAGVAFGAVLGDLALRAQLNDIDSPVCEIYCGRLENPNG